MRKIIPVIFILFGFGCADQNNTDQSSSFVEESHEKIDFVETNQLDSITYALSLNSKNYSHLDSVRVYLNIINFSNTQKILVDTFYNEFGLEVLDKNNNSPVVAYWEEYRSTTFDHPDEIQARKIAINPKEKIQVSFWLTKKLDFELRNKIVPKGEYTMYYKYYYHSTIDSSFVQDSTKSLKFYLEQDCGVVKN